MNNFVDKFMSNISSSAYSFYDDISTNTITIRLKTAFMTTLYSVSVPTTWTS